MKSSSSEMKNKLASSISSISKFQSCDGYFPSKTLERKKPEFTASSKFIDFSTKESQASTRIDENKFKERRNGQDNFTLFKRESNKKGLRYDVSDASVIQSSFLDSILDRSSSIFSVRSRQRKETESVRKKLDDAWNFQSGVLYDDERETTNNHGSIQIGYEKDSNADSVVINDESIFSRRLGTDGRSKEINAIP
mmetsp:Transcript_31896/g.36424  ORF Transcript_31896/g.36424 Transcript_31896/m.36424 type:complete len:195 (+) Transcript_31896:2-586(+)